jgi:transcriptional regulator with XRE-family HTH domain
MSSSDTIAARLKAWRHRNNFTQLQATEIFTQYGLPVSRRSLENWETGRRRPTAVSTAALTRFLDQYPVFIDGRPTE